MIWAKGIAGFITGFLIALALAGWALRKVPNQRLLSDDNLKHAGSAIIWAIAALFAYIATRL